MNSYKELIVWQKSMELTKLIYKATENFPKTEIFGLVSQMRRAAVAIPSNIAEGFSRNHTKEYRQFLHIAYGSAAELETQIILSCDLKFMEDEQIQPAIQLLDEVRRMLNKLITVLTGKQTNH